MGDVLNFIPDDISEKILTVALILSLAMPALEKVVRLTKNTWDDKVYDTLLTILGLIPRVRLGHGVTEKIENKNDPGNKP